MSSVQALREFITERLTAAAGEIFTVFQQTIVQYEEEIDRQRRLLETSWKPKIKPLLTGKSQQVVCEEEREEPKHPQIKEEQEETEPQQITVILEDFSSGLDEEKLELKQETDALLVPLTDGDCDHVDPESDSEHLLSHHSAAGENQDKTRLNHLKSTRNAELKLIKDNMNTAHLTESQRETGAGKKCLKWDLYGADENISEAVQIHRNHTCEKPHACQLCGKRFSKKRDLLQHMRTHTGEKPYPCVTCGKSFTNQGVLYRHMRTHTGEKPYSCETCGKRFSEHGILLRHKRTHTGEKPYVCETCGKRFSQQGNMMIHTRTHTGQKPYSCETCGKCFSQQGTLLRHVKIHTGENLRHPCNICGKNYTDHKALKRHTMLHLGKNFQP
ncbi:zinc finger protein 771-like [Salarias fasciatus]|uniref:Zinc finger protein GLI4-like n=1 Tax=Salarias fasciatus TaxID=181472 RepID=A0A672IR73_SALFA|nr:zinc finger protein 771-like [Salarias fasciatus]